MIVLFLALGALSACGLVPGDDPDEPLVCEEGRTACNDTCVNTQSDKANCGGCDVRCGGTLSCVDGACVQPEPCQPGECGNGTYCSEISGRCTTGCISDDGCPGAQTCDLETNACRCQGDLVACAADICCERVRGTTLRETGDYTSLDLSLDASGNAHLVAQRANQDIYYLRPGQDDSFEVESVWLPDVAQSIPGGQTITLDSSGTPHVAYLSERADGSTLYHAVREDGDWVTEAVEPTADAIAIPSILASSSGIHIAYRSFEPEVSYHLFEGERWASSTVYDAEHTGAPELAIDQNGQVRMAFWDSATEEMRILDPLAPEDGVSTPTMLAPRAPALAYDANNNPRLVFADGDTQLTYLRRDDDRWLSDVFGSARLGADPRMVLDAQDQPHVVYVQRNSTEVTYARREAGQWRHMLVGSTVDGEQLSSERWVDIAMTSDDIPVIAYVEDTGAVRVIRVDSQP
jgi:hypothetical protein